mmetsp:Transcript_13137/g.17189  ORF Transcript_13137/g.17189 Transcript_13137/m.17189 type:complete len:347 (+) Transcript_13137:94-1134(+)
MKEGKLDADIRRRKAKVYKENNDVVKKKVNEDTKKKNGFAELAKVFALPLFMCSVVFVALYYQYGIYIFMSSAMKEANLSEKEVEVAVSNHTFLFVGGPHRGGTTILWQCLREHPAISGFGDRVGADASEGIFIQSVFPQFGIGAEINSAKMATQQTRTLAMKGLGQYAFNPEAHMTEDHYLVTLPWRRKLFNQWAYFWDLEKPVLLEKSPTTMVYSRFIQAMFTSSLDFSNDPTSANFVFITRHPLANAYAHKTWTACASMTNFELVLHWVISHEIKNNTNEKYEATYCKELLASKSNFKKHQRLVSKLGERILKLGYNLNDFGICQIHEDSVTFKGNKVSIDIN